MKSSFLAALLALVMITPAFALEKTTLSYVTWNADFGYIMAAVDKGYFIEEGLDVELVAAGGGVAIPAMISNSLDFSGSGSTAISAILKGAKLKVLMVGQDRSGWQLWSQNPQLKELADLKDQQIGVISRGDSGEIAMRYLLMKHNLPSNYVAYTPLGNGTGRLAAISTGAIPANLMVWGEVEKLKTQGSLAGAHLISNLTTEFRMVFNGLASSDRMIHDQPDTVLKMVRALMKGQTYVRSFRDQSVAMMARYSKSEEKDAASDYDHILPAIARDGTVDASVRANEVSLRSEMLDIPSSSTMKAQDVFDFLPAREALEELTNEGWKPTP